MTITSSFNGNAKNSRQSARAGWPARYNAPVARRVARVAGWGMAAVADAATPWPWALADGFRYSGTHCGLRPDPDRRDLAIFASDRPCTAAGVFTQNQVVAAPVHLCRERLPSDQIRAVVVCSGNANACTGDQGRADAERQQHHRLRSPGDDGLPSKKNRRMTLQSRRELRK